MKKIYYCPLFKKEIDEGKCLDINYELILAKTEEELKLIKIKLSKKNEEIEKICERCPNYPL